MNAQQTTLAQGGPDVPPLPRSSAEGRRRVVIVLIVVLVIAGIGLLVLRGMLTPSSPDAQPSDSRTNPVAPIPSAATLPSALTEATARLSRLEERTAGLVQRLNDLTDNVGNLTATVTAQADATQQLRSRLVALDKHQRSTPRRARPSKPAPPAKPKLPAIVSVDLWGNRASVAIREADGRLGFYREGDTVGLARIQRIDAAAQKVQLRLPDGTVTTIGIQE